MWKNSVVGNILSLMLCSIMAGCGWMYKPDPYPPGAPSEQPSGLPSSAPLSGGGKPVLVQPLSEPGVFDAIAVERFECLAGEEARAWFYTGAASLSGSPGAPASVAKLALNQRYVSRFRAALVGVDSTDWWCIPRKRICYSKADFKSWDGKHRRGDIIDLGRLKVYSAERHTIPTILQSLYVNQCE